MVLNNLPQREEYLRKKRRKKYIRLGIFFLFLILVIGLISYISYRPQFRITDVVLSGGILVTEKDVEKESKKFISGSYFWLFPRNNAFLYKKESLKDYLKDTFKRIDTIEIKLDGLSKIIIEITERKPVAVWCDSLEGSRDTSISQGVAGITLSTSTEVIDTPSEEVTIISKNPKCYFIDQNSTIFAEAPNFSGDAYFKYYGLVGKESPIGKEYIASSTEFTHINNFIEAIKKLSIKPLYLIAKEEGEFSVVLYGGGELYFDVKKSLELTYKNLETLLNSSELSFKQGYLPVEYIDLRYGNKLFYKLKTN